MTSKAEKARTKKITNVNPTDQGQILTLCGAIKDSMEQTEDCLTKTRVLEIAQKIEALIIKDLEAESIWEGIGTEKIKV